MRGALHCTHNTTVSGITCREDQRDNLSYIIVHTYIHCIIKLSIHNTWP